MASQIQGGDNYKRQAVSGDAPPALQNRPPGGKSDDDMEARVSTLEKRFDRMEGKLDGLVEKVSDVRIDMAGLKERVAHLPSKGWAVGVAITTVTLLSAIAILAPKLQAWVGVLPK